MVPGFIIGFSLMVIGYALSFVKPKQGKDGNDWLGGFIAGGGMILFLACFSAWITR